MVMQLYRLALSFPESFAVTGRSLVYTLYLPGKWAHKADCSQDGHVQGGLFAGQATFLKTFWASFVLQRCESHVPCTWHCIFRKPLHEGRAQSPYSYLKVGG